MPADRPPDDQAEQLRRQRLLRELSRDVGRFLLDAARAHPPPWPEPAPEREKPAPKRRRRQPKDASDAR